MCPEVASSPSLLRHGFTAFGGSACEVLLVDGAEDELSAVVAEVYAFEAQLTRFKPGSELGRFNAAAGREVEVSPLLQVLLQSCLDAHALSEGLVNAAIHNALVAAGYDRTIAEVRARPGVPRPALPAPPLPEILQVGDGWARLAAGQAIDLGGVGKGWLADRLCERFDNACVNLGGDLRALGEGAGGLGWGVGLCDGRALRVRDGGVATSGTVGRRWAGGHHLIDPRSGRPVSTRACAISVAAHDAFTAEVLAKAAILVGAAEAPTWLRDHGAIDHAFIEYGQEALIS